MDELAQQTVMKDLESSAFQSGVMRGNWKVHSFQFPKLVIGVLGTEPDGSRKMYYVRYLLDEFPTKPPHVQIWNIETDQVLAHDQRPKGNAKVVLAFQPWSDDTVYRPWERMALAHNDWVHKYASEAWHPGMTLTFTVEDLHGILNANALVVAAKGAASA